MSDLISRSKVISVLEQLEEHSLTGKMDIYNAIYLLNNQPTAYSVGKVVSELEEMIHPKQLYFCKYARGGCKPLYNDDKDCMECVVENAIEIVKQGGVADDVCEWKQTSTAKYKTSCGYKLEEYFDTNACYCKQCGKKIKIVGD